MKLKGRIERLSIPEPNTGCWLWLGSVDRGGYARINVAGRNAVAHRVAYEEFVGPIANDLQIDHLCRVRSCVNPQHLEPVSQRENVLRGVGVTSVNAKKSTCPRGHPLSVVDGEGRRCLACRQAQNRRRVKNYKLRKRARV